MEDADGVDAGGHAHEVWRGPDDDRTDDREGKQRVPAAVDLLTADVLHRDEEPADGDGAGEEVLDVGGGDGPRGVVEDEAGTVGTRPAGDADGHDGERDSRRLGAVLPAGVDHDARRDDGPHERHP